MSISLPNRAIAAGLAIAVALWLGGTALFVPAAQAVTISELEAQIADLMAQLSALKGTSTGTGTCYSFTRDLYNGVSGDDVKMLQDYLTGTGHFTFAGGSTGFFGPITTSAVAAWQTANGVAPTAGYFGSISRAKYNSVCGSGTGTGTTGTGTALQGGAGSADYKLMSGISGEEVGEDADDVEVIGVEVEAQGSDLELLAVRVNFDQGTANNDFEEYAAEVAVFLDGEELGRVDADEFNDDNAFQSTISLDKGGVVEEGETGELTVAVTGAKNIDSNDVTETWTADVNQVRYMDAQGSTVSEDPGTGTRTFSFETFATASDLELHITLAKNDAVNKAHLIDVHATENTRSTILDFELENEGDTDLEYKEFGVNITVTGSANVDDFIAGGTSPQIYLVLDGEEYGTANYQDDADDISVGAAEDVLFDDVNFTHPAGEIVSGQIEVVIRGLDEDPDLGDTIVAVLTETETDQAALVDIRDESNTQLADAQITGAASAEANEIRDVGFDLELVSTTAVKTTGNASTGTSDSGEFTITFKVTAWGGDIFIDATAPTRAGTTESNVTTSVSTGTLTTDILTTSGATEGAQAFVVLEGDSESFSIVGRVADGATDDLADGYLDMSLTSLRYALTQATGDLTYTLNLGKFKTPSIFLDDQGQ